jgi:serine/threonine protein kinase
VFLYWQFKRLEGRPHPNVVQRVGAPFVSSSARTLYLPLELCTGGDAMEALEALGTRLPLPSVLNLLQQAVAGLLHCHSQGVYHLDVKPDNMLLTGVRGHDPATATLKIADFGNADVAPEATRVRAGGDPTGPRCPRPGCSGGSGTGTGGACVPPCLGGSPRMATQSQSQSSAPPLPPFSFRTTSDCGTPAYAAPEALACKRDSRRQRACSAGSAGSAGSASSGSYSAASSVSASSSASAGTACGGHGGRRGSCGGGASGGEEGEPTGAGVPTPCPLPAGDHQDCCLRAAYDAGKADVWSLGVSMVVLATGYFPWREARPSDARYAYWAGAWQGVDLCPEVRQARLTAALRDVAEGEAEAARVLPDGLLRLLVCMLNPDPAARVTMDEVADDWWLLGEGATLAATVRPAFAVPSAGRAQEECGPGPGTGGPVADPGGVSGVEVEGQVEPEPELRAGPAGGSPRLVPPVAVAAPSPQPVPGGDK